MTGYIVATGPCWSCGRIFMFDPDTVPSIPIDGVRQPICRTCMDRANAVRVEQGLVPHAIRPDAYLSEET